MIFKGFDLFKSLFVFILKIEIVLKKINDRINFFEDVSYYRHHNFPFIIFAEVIQNKKTVS